MAKKHSTVIFHISHTSGWGLFGSKDERKDKTRLFSFTIPRIDPFTSDYVILRPVISSFYTDVIKLRNCCCDHASHFRSRIIIFVIHIYRGLINYNINIHTRSREVQRVNPSSGNTGIAYIRRRKLFLETSSSNIILLHPCLLVYLTTNRILVILGYTNLPIFRIPLHLYFV